MTITWFGHSTILIQMSGLNILIDPVFRERTSPVSFIGPKRFTKKSKENLTTITPSLGQTVNYKEYNLYTENYWWKKYK